MKHFHVVCAAIFVLVAATAVTFVWQSGLATFHDDSVSYLIMGRMFSPFHSASPAIIEAFPFEKYPPLFPLLLAATDGAYRLTIAHALVALSFAASVVLLGVLARQTLRQDAMAYVCILLFVLLPGCWLNLRGILSEFPYVCLVLATLIYLNNIGDRIPTRRQSLILGLLLAAVLLTRWIGIALIGAVVLGEVLRFARTRSLARASAIAWGLIVPFAFCLLWLLIRPYGGDDDYVKGSIGIFSGARDGVFAQIFERVAVNAVALGDAWNSAIMIYWRDSADVRFLLSTLIGLLALGAALVRMWQGKADGAYSVFFLLILVLWPYPGQMYRLILPVVPILLLQWVWAVSEAFRRSLPQDNRLTYPCLAACIPLALSVPALFFIVQRAMIPDQPGERYQKTHIFEFFRTPDRRTAEAYAEMQTSLFGDMDRINATTDPDARIMWFGANYVALLANRRGVPLEYPKNESDMAAQVRRYRPNLIFVANVVPRDSFNREGNPLAPMLYSREYTEIVWSRTDPATGALRSALLKVVPERVIMDTAPAGK